jgi:hypothetical protein
MIEFHYDSPDPTLPPEAIAWHNLHLADSARSIPVLCGALEGLQEARPDMTLLDIELEFRQRGFCTHLIGIIVPKGAGLLRPEKCKYTFIASYSPFDVLKHCESFEENHERLRYACAVDISKTISKSVKLSVKDKETIDKLLKLWHNQAYLRLSQLPTTAYVKMIRQEYPKGRVVFVGFEQVSQMPIMAWTDETGEMVGSHAFNATQTELYPFESLLVTSKQGRK